MNIESKLRDLRNQRDGISPGHYRTYLVNIYNLYYRDAKNRGTNWSEGISKYRLTKATYEGVDEIPSSYNALRWKDDLKKMGYLCEQKVDGVWRTYILKELDF